MTTQPLDECTTCYGENSSCCPVCRGTGTRPQPLDLDAIQARCDAATPGRWHWHGTSDDHDFRLQTASWDIVMDFVRHGTQGAQPRFNVGGLMETATELLPDGQSAVRGLQHPDAQFIAAARTDVPTLLYRVRELEAKCTALQAECDGWAEAGRNEERIWAARVAELEQQLAAVEHGRDGAIEAAEQLQAAINQMPRCNAPHPVTNGDLCERQPGHDGWHAADAGAWPATPLPPLATSTASSAR